MGFPLMYRPPKLRVVPADVRLLRGCFLNLVNLCGTSSGFPMMYRPPKLRVVPADVRLRVNHQFDVLHRSLGVVASPGFQSSLFDGPEHLCS